MSYRTTYAAVAKIAEIESSYDEDSFEPFIEAANALVTEKCSTDDYDDTRLELIERWLSAHFYCIREMRAEMEKAGSVSEKKQSKVDLGFDVTHYGQMAMRFDTAGGLAKLNQEIKSGGVSSIGFTWLGDNDTNNEDYVG